MKNKLLIAIAVIAVLLIGGGAYLTLSKSHAPSSQNIAKENPKESPSAVMGSIKDLLTGGKTQTCTISYPNNAGSGTFYVSDKKFSGEFTIKDDKGTEMTGHTVSDGTYVYIWSSAAPMGIKVKLDSAINAASGETKAGNMNFNEQVNYKCGPWIVDSSKFQVPTNMQFSDMSNLMNQTKPSATTPTTEGVTSPCDQLTNPQAKAACESAMQQQH